MKKIIFNTITTSMSFISVVVYMFLFWHVKGLYPEALFEFPIDEFVDLPHRDGYITLVGTEIDKICHENGFSKGQFFATQGYKVYKFIPTGFYCRSGYIDVYQANTNTVYFYRYRKRYSFLVEYSDPIWKDWSRYKK